MRTKVRNSEFMLVAFVSLIAIYFSLFTDSYAAHPLITDDADTQGKGKFQIEVNGEFTTNEGTEDDVTTKETGGEVASIVSYGPVDNADIVLGIPYQWAETMEDGDVTSDEAGIGDMSIEVKWRFYEKGGLSFALKPGITLPTGNEDKGLGSGKASYGLTLITTEETGAWALNLNLGYLHNKYKREEDEDANRKGIWHASLSSQVEVMKNLTTVANIGMERNPDKESNTHPAFVLGGLIYSITENLDIDMGIKAALNKPEKDLTFLAGVAMRY